ncbi:MAG: cupin domain-containing protein [Chloroflexota bacterium]
MILMQLHVTPWTESTPPTESALREILTREGLDFYSWSNGPYDIYAPHAHAYDKVIYVVRGSITFQLIDLGQWHTLNAGDRLDLPAGIIHAAEVGVEGVVCLEAHC